MQFWDEVLGATKLSFYIRLTKTNTTTKYNTNINCTWSLRQNALY